MRFPVIVIGYGSFANNNKLFFYEIGGLGCLPIFTDPTIANLFLSSATERMGDLLTGKPPLTTMACSKKEHILDILKLITMIAQDVKIVELNPYPLNDKYRKKLADSGVMVDSQKYDIAEMIEMLQNQE
jgi:hypothetical protein